MVYGIIEHFIDNFIMKKINFKEISVQTTLEGDIEVFDFRKVLGNILYRGSDIELSDFGRTIYYSEEEIEIPEALIQAVVQMVSTSSLIAPAKTAILSLLKKEE